MVKSHQKYLQEEQTTSWLQIRNQIYCTAVLPKLDYYSTVWDSHSSTDINRLESMQKFAGKVITKQWKADYPTLLASLKWQPLSTRKRFQKLEVCISSNVFTLHPRPSPCHPHNQTLLQPFVKLKLIDIPFLLVLSLFGTLSY